MRKFFAILVGLFKLPYFGKNFKRPLNFTWPILEYLVSLMYPNADFGCYLSPISRLKREVYMSSEYGKLQNRKNSVCVYLHNVRYNEILHFEAYLSPNTPPVLCYAKVVSFIAHIFYFRISMLQDNMIP